MGTFARLSPSRLKGAEMRSRVGWDWDTALTCDLACWLRCEALLSLTDPALIVSTSAVERYHAMRWMGGFYKRSC